MNEFSFENARLSSGFGPRRAPVRGASTFHKGQDYAVPEGTPITARSPWRVEEARSQGAPGRLKGWGHYILLTSPQYPGYTVRLAHLRELPRRGLYPAGTVIAYSGASGLGSGPHVHMELLVGTKAMDPRLAPWRRGVPRPPLAPARPPRSRQPLARAETPKAPAAAPRPTRMLTVRKGDTLWALAAREGNARDNAARQRWIRAVLKLNPGLAPRNMQVGAKLRVPAEAQA